MIGAPSIFKLIRKPAALARVLPTFVFVANSTSACPPPAHCFFAFLFFLPSHFRIRKFSRTTLSKEEAHERVGSGVTRAAHFNKRLLGSSKSPREAGTQGNHCVYSSVFPPKAHGECITCTAVRKRWQLHATIYGDAEQRSCCYDNRKATGQIHTPGAGLSPMPRTPSCTLALLR